MPDEQIDELRQMVVSNARSIQAQGDSIENLLQTVVLLSKTRGRLDDKMMALDLDIRSLLQDILSEVKKNNGHSNT